MKLSSFFLAAFFTFSLASVYGQTFTTNTTPVGMEHNILFNATTHYTVTQTGAAPLNLSYLFDGKFVPSYTSTAPTTASPTVVLIEDLPAVHVQTGAWVGWSTRYWEARNFKIEGYNTYNGTNVNTNEWVTIADYSTTNYTGGRKFSVRVPSSRAYTKLRFTFYNAVGTNGRLGVSELFYIHPEATTPYANLGLGTWSIKNSDVSTLNKVGIGTTNPQNELSVNGTIWGKKIRIKLTDAADWVFEDDYNLRPLSEVENFIKTHKHLPEIPSAEEFRTNDMEVSQMTNKLLQKIEELTLYTIAQEKKIEEQNEKLDTLLNRLEALEQSKN